MRKIYGKITLGCDEYFEKSRSKHLSLLIDVHISKSIDIQLEILPIDVNVMDVIQGYQDRGLI